MKTHQHLEIIDSIKHPSNSQLNPIVNHLLSKDFKELLEAYGHKEAGRLVRGALRLRKHYYIDNSSKTRSFYQNVSLNGWLTMQMSGFNNN